jgi:ABC-2 type transport system permease protein
VAELAGTLSIYRRLIGARIRADWQYRTSFLLFFAGQVLVAGADFAAIAVIFSSVNAIDGWSASQVAFLFGMSGLSFGLGDLFISQVEHASTHIKAGTFDQFLIRPIGTMWQLSGAEFATRRLGRSIQPIIVLVIALAVVDVAWTPAHILLVPLTVISGFVIFGAVWVVTSSLSFWTVETQEVASAFTYGGSTLTSYPIDVLGTWLKRIATFIVPLASVVYLPACALFDKPMPFDLPEWVAWTGPAVALIGALIARTVWVTAIRHYRSTGS